MIVVNFYCFLWYKYKVTGGGYLGVFKGYLPEFNTHIKGLVWFLLVNTRASLPMRRRTGFISAPSMYYHS